MNIARKPTQQEREELFEYLSTLIWYDIDEPEKEAWDAVEAAAIAVFDNYVSDSPSYVGKIMMVIWNGGPQMYGVFIWQDGEIVPVTQDPPYFSKE